uniref:Sodium:proton antiporter n=1 Tax=Ignisphaera aggregans TaxID=334771 RepID=A0A7C2ZQ53_9CREN
MKPVNLLVIITLILSASFLLTFASSYIVPTENLRRLALFYLVTTYNPETQYTALSPEGVTAIVWDYRGLDTLFETAVFFLALIAALSLVRGLYAETPPQEVSREAGLSTIVKTVTRITAPMIIAVGASVALHGHLTPGGGFQGGSIVAVAPMVFMVIFSSLYVLRKGVTTTKMLVLRSIGLIGVGLTSIAVFMAGLILGELGYVFQNMPKPGAPLGMPSHVGGTLISGTLWFFNLFEMFAVAAGFTLIFIVLLIAGKKEG